MLKKYRKDKPETKEIGYPQEVGENRIERGDNGNGIAEIKAVAILCIYHFV